ncbi:hypothetical protein OXIME_000972 [Oxyplasma meridianum]|uniref:Uncharacterized protein n=1 Tax=Oxyplasma meridianum TaxID=3073602 RepID=A0AAX4NFW7_9ARCH
MQERSSFFIIDRYKKMSYIAGYIPVEYNAKNIISDMAKAGMEEVLTEDEIKEFLENSKNRSYEKILDRIKKGYSVSEIMQWCKLSIECVVPLCNFQCNVPGMENVAYGYFSFEVKRIIENELEKILKRFRREHGREYNSNDLLSVLDEDNIYHAGIEMEMNIQEDKLKSMISDFEKNSILRIREYVLNAWSQPEVMERSENDDDIVFGHSELLDIIPNIIRKERFRIIGKNVVNMKNNEILAFIGAVEKMRLLKMIRSDTKLGEKSDDKAETYSSEFMTHTASLSQDELSVLIETLRAYMNWRSLLSFVQISHTLPTKEELADSIIKGFSESNGTDKELLKTFLIKEE